MVHETHRTPGAAAERAEAMRRQAKQGELVLPAKVQVVEDDLGTDESKQAR